EGGGVTFQLGDPAKDRLWGTVTASYSEADGLVVGGLVNVKIKDGMIGTGWLTYSTKKGSGNAGVTVQRIPILETEGVTKKLVDFDRPIPVFSFFGITLILDVRFTLAFLYGLKLGITPTVQVNGIDFHDLSFEEAIATIEVDGDLSAALQASPGVGLGIALLAPELVSGIVGLSVPITAGAHVNPRATMQATYDKDGGLKGGASLGMSLNFGITGAVVANADVNVLMGAWKPHWDKELTSFTIMQPRELFNWTLDLGEPIKKHEPMLPDGGPAPTAQKPKGTKVIESQARSGSPAKQTGPSKNTGSDNGNAGVAQFLPQLKQIPEYQTLDAILHEAIELWEKFKHVVGAIKDAVKAGLVTIKNAASWVGQGVWDGISWVGDRIGDAAAGAYHLAGDVASGAYDLGSDALGAIGSGLGSLI
ncbi:MAG TPA: hypothetical protein VK601_17605, partial [Kofleriaceae bacterium]|nr:hypothetical protein [Kofleriaceae bacterium]